MRKLGARPNTTYETYRAYIDTRPPEIVANILICLIHQTNYLLDQQIRALEKAFLAEGGLREAHDPAPASPPAHSKEARMANNLKSIPERILVWVLSVPSVLFVLSAPSQKPKKPPIRAHVVTNCDRIEHRKDLSKSSVAERIPPTVPLIFSPS